MAAKLDPTFFTWNHPNQMPQLRKLIAVLEVLPYDRLVNALAEMRGRGRNDYPAEAMFRLMIAGIVLQSPSAADLIRHVSSNPMLAGICGFNPLPVQQKPKRSYIEVNRTVEMQRTDYELRDTLPNEPALSRFLHNVLALQGQHDYVKDMFVELRTMVEHELPDFGRYLAYDGSAIESHSTGKENRKTGETSDTDADWGKHETQGVDKKGNVWKKVKSWFGYCLHIIVDSDSGLPVDYEVTVASASEQKQLARMIPQLTESSQAIRERAVQFSADKGLDGNRIYDLIGEHGMVPIIDNRTLWSQEKKDGNYDPEKPILRMLNDGKEVDNILYSERGTVYCHVPGTQETRPMSWYGYEKDRDTLKYRCPAKVGGFECSGMEQCLEYGSSSAFDYGRTVRIKVSEHNSRIFTKLPRDSLKWQKGYNLRSEAERFFSRLKGPYMLDHHYVRGLSKMRTKISLATVVMMAMAIVRIRSGQQEHIRSLVKPLPIPDRC